ncbi:hypothetical protein [Psychrobacillus sp. NPDC093180]|uniref:hypothetical protein n=1 Tax=Psychrobacillus sp. NPDC093180 TaxID=3364489 RepID=UPI0037FCBF0C
MVEQVSTGLEGMRGLRVIVKKNIRDEKDACITIVLPDAQMKEWKEKNRTIERINNG